MERSRDWRKAGDHNADVGGCLRVAQSADRRGQSAYAFPACACCSIRSASARSTKPAMASSGLEVLRERKCDLILADLAMKPMDGLEFTRAIRTAERGTNPFMPIIMITGHTEKYRVEAARDCRRHRISGQADHGAKPVLPASPRSWSGPAPLSAATAISVPTAAASRPRITPVPGGGMTISRTWRCNDQESPGHSARRLSPDGEQERGRQTVPPAALERHHRPGRWRDRGGERSPARRRARLCARTGTGHRRSPHHGGKGA